MKQRISAHRIGRYALGMALLAVGLTLTAQSGLGTSPLTAIAYVAAQRLGWRFADMVLVMFSLFVLGEILLEKQKTPRNIALLLLQLPLSVAFTRLMALVQRWVNLSGASVPLRFLVLAAAIVFTGVGAAATLRANLIPNPGDGIVRSLAAHFGQPLGRTKNAFDIFNVTVAAALSLLFFGRLTGVGVGSLCAMLGVGRVIALYQRLVK